MTLCLLYSTLRLCQRTRLTLLRIFLQFPPPPPLATRDAEGGRPAQPPEAANLPKPRGHTTDCPERRFQTLHFERTGISCESRMGTRASSCLGQSGRAHSHSPRYGPQSRACPTCRHRGAIHTGRPTPVRSAVHIHYESYWRMGGPHSMP